MPAVETGQSNGGFRAEELTRRNFQRITAETINRHVYAINQLQQQIQAKSEFMADLSVRIDELGRTITAEEVARKLDVGELRSRLTAFKNRLRWLFIGQ